MCSANFVGLLDLRDEVYPESDSPQRHIIEHLARELQRLLREHNLVRRIDHDARVLLRTLLPRRPPTLLVQQMCDELDAEFSQTCLPLSCHDARRFTPGQRFLDHVGTFGINPIFDPASLDLKQFLPKFDFEIDADNPMVVIDKNTGEKKVITGDPGCDSFFVTMVKAFLARKFHDIGPIPQAIGVTLPPTKQKSDNLTPLLQRGKRCEELAEEIRKIRRYCQDNGLSMSEIRTNYQVFAIWTAVEPLSKEDMETFNHPGTWGAADGYANRVLGKLYSRSPITVNNWRKKYRDYLRNTPNQ